MTDATAKPTNDTKNVVSIVDKLERRQIARLREQVDAMHLRGAEALLAPYELKKQLEEVDFDELLGQIAASDEIDDAAKRKHAGQLRCARGHLRCLQGDLDAGMAEFAAVMAEIPELAQPYVSRAQWTPGGDARAALVDLDRAAALEPTNANVYWRRGQCYAQLDDHERALANYRRSLAILPDAMDVLHDMGKSFSAREEHAEAVTAYDRAIAVAPRYVELFQGRAEAHEALGHDEAAIEDYDRILALVPTRNDARFARARTNHRLGRDEAAVAELVELAALEPDDRQYHAWLGITRVKLGEHRDALASLDRAVEIDPADHGSHSLRAQALAALGDTAGAILAVDRAIEIAPEEPLYTAQRAGFTFGPGSPDAGSPAAAHALFEALFPLFDREPSFVAAGATLAARTGDHGRAVELLDATIAKTPDDAKLYLARAKAHAQLGHAEQALGDARRAAELDPTCAEAHALSGYYQQYVECDEPRIEAAFARALALAPDNVSFRHERAKFYVSVDRYAAAARDYDRLIELVTDRVDFYLERADCRANGPGIDEEGEEAWAAGETPEQKAATQRGILADCEKARELGLRDDDERSDYFIKVAWAYRELGEKEAAIATLDRGIEECPTEPYLFSWRAEFKKWLNGDVEGGKADRARARELGLPLSPED